MGKIYDCLKTVIGLSKETCPCFPTVPAGYNTSKSGVFLAGSQLSIPLKLPMKASDCLPTVNGWVLMENAREAGVREYLRRLTTGTYPRYKSKKPFEGFVGDDRASFVLQGKKAHTGVAFAPKIYKGVKLRVNTLQVWVDAAGDYEVKSFYDSKLRKGDVTPENSQVVTVNPGQPYGEQALATPWEFDFSNANQEPETVYLVYERGSANPRNITFDCGCSNNRPWEEYFRGFGMEADTIEGLYSYAGQTSHPNGLRAAVSLSCGFDWLCQSWDWDNDPFASTTADAILLFSIRALVESLLLSGDINPLTYLNREELIQRGEAVHALALERMAWITANIPTNLTDCLRCQDTYSLGSAL